MATKQQLTELVVKLRDDYDHAFIDREGVDHFTKPFGFRGTTFLAQANPQEIKGLTLYDYEGNQIDEMEGQDASVVAREICDHLGLQYIPKFGRGSMLRSCCEAIIKHLQEAA